MKIINAVGPIDLGDKLRLKLTSRGFTQRQFVRRMNLDEPTVSKLFNGVRDSQLYTWISLENDIDSFLAMVED